MDISKKAPFESVHHDEIENKLHRIFDPKSHKSNMTSTGKGGIIMLTQEENDAFSSQRCTRIGKKTCRGHDLVTGIMYIEKADKLVVRKQRTIKIGGTKVVCILVNSKIITGMTDLEVKKHIEFGENILKSWFLLTPLSYRQDRAGGAGHARLP